MCAHADVLTHARAASLLARSFHMDVLQNRKSDALEWTIIVLICAEVGLGLYDIVTRV